MRTAPPLLSLLAALSLSSAAPPGCTTGRIPNTDVADSSENRSVVAFCERYRRAVEARDVNNLLALASPRYFEDAGTPRGDDDYGYDGLQRLLAAWADDVREVRYEIRYRRVSVDPDHPERLLVDLTFTGSYTLRRPPAVRDTRPGRGNNPDGGPALSIDPVRGATAQRQDDDVWYRRVGDNRLELERQGDGFRIVAGM